MIVVRNQEVWGTFLNSDILFTCIYLFVSTSDGHYSII